MITVGHHGTGYVQERELLITPNSDIRFVRTDGTFDIPTVLERPPFGSAHETSFFGCMHEDFGLNDDDVFHLVNIVGATPTPHIGAFEHYLPRWNPSSLYAMKLLPRPPVNTSSR